MSGVVEEENVVWKFPIQTRDGDFLAHYSNMGLCGLDFPGLLKVETATASNVSCAIQQWHEETMAALDRALAGGVIQKLPTLDLSSGTDFQQRVWRILQGIPCGQTLSYGQVADELGDRNAVRAVGRACGSNPIPVLIPCHRVLASKQKIGGFSGGLDWKRKLLAREGVLLLA